MTYEKYKQDCKELGFNPTMSEKDFKEMMGIDTFQLEPLIITPNNAKRPIEPTIENYHRMELA